MMPQPPNETVRRAELMRGFTLIELSIVLVIIGLIVGGVLVGQDLIKAAQIRSLIKQQVQFKAAVGAFRDKYVCLPGDCINAASFGFTAPVLNPQNYPVNGNGDGIIGDPTGTFSGAWGLPESEQFTFWHQLFQAGYIPTDAMPANQMGYTSANIRNDSWFVSYSNHAVPGAVYPSPPLGSVLALTGPLGCGFLYVQRRFPKG
jgi:prepilin-type N-terminal cleavage/methylation domain-containing protein